DVVHPFLVLSTDADCASALLNGRIRHNLVHLRRVRSLLRTHAGMDLNLIRGAAGEMDIARAGGHAEVELSICCECAVEGTSRLRSLHHPVDAAGEYRTVAA